MIVMIVTWKGRGSAHTPAAADFNKAGARHWRNTASNASASARQLFKGEASSRRSRRFVLLLCMLFAALVFTNQ